MLLNHFLINVRSLDNGGAGAYKMTTGPATGSRFSRLCFRIPDRVLGNIGEQLGGAAADDENGVELEAATSRNVMYEEEAWVAEELS